MRPRIVVFTALVVIALCCALAFFVRAKAPPLPPELARELAAYRETLTALREGTDTFAVPQDEFYLFGMGDRRKLLFKDGVLSDLMTSEIVRRWDATDVTIVPSAYAVSFAAGGERYVIAEDEDGIHIRGGGGSETIENSPVSLPTFDGNIYAPILRSLHQEILVNIVDSKPLPNILAYAEPWYRDGAMVAMVLQKTGNLGLLREWIESIRDPFDRNNGEDEADNPGEVLYLISLVDDATHPAVQPTLEAAKRFEQGGHIVGRTDGAEHAVYQTQWMKLGLRSLGLEDPYSLPEIDEPYGALAWWSPADPRPAAHGQSPNAPYLAWAAHHADISLPGVLPDRDYPLSYEADASKADYGRMAVISPSFTDARVTMPHTWHAAEMFLFLLDDGAL